MKYYIIIEKRARKFINKQNPEQQKRILSAIAFLPDGDTKMLQASKKRYRLRVGDYRILYMIENDKLLITVIDAGNRGQIYNK